MKEYQKTYEDLYTSERITSRCELDKVSFDGYLNRDEYIKLFYDTVRETQLSLFDIWVKTYWLIINFSYNGKVRNSIGYRDRNQDMIFAIFCRSYINFNKRLYTNGAYFNKIATYFTDFFPEIKTSDPFKTKFEYPFKYMSFDCLFLVYQMPDRIQLLEIGERDKMTYPKFLDYIINHVLCYNEECGETKYELFMKTSGCPPYIKYEDYANNQPRKRTRRRKRKKFRRKNKT